MGSIIPDPGHLFSTSTCRHIVLGFVDVSYLVLSTYQTWEGATGQGVGLGVFGGMLAWVPGSEEDGGGYVVWVRWAVAINTIASILIRCASSMWHGRTMQQMTPLALLCCTPCIATQANQHMCINN